MAIERLKIAANEDNSKVEDISVNTFIDTLTENIRRTFPEVQISLSKEAEFSMPILVGIALADATIQALKNSMQHAGTKVVRQVRLKADNHGLKVVIKDDGRGFD